MGTTVESGRYTHRIEALRSTPAAVKFVSFEPLLSAIPEATDLSQIDWAIVGGESGPHSRPMDPEWARGIRGICQRFDTAFFFKQWGGKNKAKAGRELDGKIWDEMPETAQSSVTV